MKRYSTPWRALGPWHRRALHASGLEQHGERHHERLLGEFCNDNGRTDATQRRSRLGSLLNFYRRNVA